MCESTKIFKYPLREENSMKLFLTQNAAIEYEQSKEGQITFSFEVSAYGGRQFLVASFEDFIQFYMTQKVKNIYEVITEQKRVKLFMDLEFLRTLNPCLDGNSLVKRLSGLVFEKLNSDYGIQVSMNDCLCLDASDSRKFSVHLIFFTVTFETIFDCGTFVKELLTKMKTEDKTNFNVQAATTKKGAFVQKSFVDQLIYTRNRQFRCFLSSKFQQDRPLVLSSLDISSSDISGDEGLSLRQILRRSLITVLEENYHTIEVKKSSNPQVLVSVPSPQERNGLKQNSSVICSNSSERDSAVELRVSKIVAPGKIRKKTVLEGGTVCYNVVGAHYCQIKGASHHSGSQIYFVYNPLKATLTQKCFSEKCRTMAGVAIEIK